MITATPVLAEKKTRPVVKALAYILFGCIAIGFIYHASTDSLSTPADVIATAVVPQGTKVQKAVQEIALRKGYAQSLDQHLLDIGIESNTYTVGSDAKKLVIRDVLAGRVRVNALSKNAEMFENLHRLGFTRLTYENGFEGAMSFTRYWDL